MSFHWILRLVQFLLFRAADHAVAGIYFSCATWGCIGLQWMWVLAKPTSDAVGFASTRISAFCLPVNE